MAFSCPTAITYGIMCYALEACLFRLSGRIWTVDVYAEGDSLKFTARSPIRTLSVLYPAEQFWGNADADHILGWLADQLLMPEASNDA